VAGRVDDLDEIAFLFGSRRVVDELRVSALPSPPAAELDLGQLLVGIERVRPDFAVVVPSSYLMSVLEALYVKSACVGIGQRLDAERVVLPTCS